MEHWMFVGLVLVTTGTWCFARSLPGTYTLRMDCSSAWECCKFKEQLEFDQCCNDHGCCPLCDLWSKGCFYGKQHYSFGSYVDQTSCMELVCVANITSTSPYITGIVIYQNTGSLGCQSTSKRNCVDEDGIYRLEGEEWFSSENCKYCKCSYGEIACGTVSLREWRSEKCPPPHPNCLPMGQGCCPIWDCDGSSSDICPDPYSFGRVCVHYFDQCVSDADCKYGHCCLVAGCGKECMSMCIDENGTTHKVGEIWYSSSYPPKKLECLENGTSYVYTTTTEETTTTTETYKTKVPLLPEPYVHPLDCLLKSGLNFSVLADQIETLGQLKEAIPIRDQKFYVDAFAALSDGGLNINLTDQELKQVEIQSRNFDWAAVLPLVNQDTTRQQASALDVGELGLRVSTTVGRIVAQRNITVEEHSPSAMHQVAFRRTDPISTKMGELGLAMGEATNRFISSFRLPSSSAGALPILGEVSDCSRRFRESLRPVLEPPCNPLHKYRTLDGTCNNLNNDLWGAAFTKFCRLLPPDYGNDVFTMRLDANGNPLPSARLVSTKINNEISPESSDLSFFHVTYGQFLDHDLTATPIAKGYLGSAIKCCDELREKFFFAESSLNNTKTAIDELSSLEPSLTTLRIRGELNITTEILVTLKDKGEQLIGSAVDSFEALIQQNQPINTNFPLQSILIPPRPTNGECAPISIPHDDEFYSCYGQTCMEFVRSVPAPMCMFGQREQLNEHTAYLDGSVIYGVKETTTNDLRTFTDGLLKSQVTMAEKQLLPPALDREDGCNVDEKYYEGTFCFKAGDGRVNEQILLTLIQTVWAREHNRVAGILKDLIGGSDEKLFQEARRIVVAELQHVTYKEYLPILLGNPLMILLDLNPLEDDDYTTHYDENLDACIANSFATAAYRFGHSQVNDFIHQVNEHGVINSESLSSMFFNPFSLYDDNLGDLTRGGTSFPSRKVDGYFSEEITGKLFRGSHPFGLDLFALNIQRGRDHGLPGYTQWKKLCEPFGSVVSTFSELESIMDKSIVTALGEVYSAVEDIDLYAGGVSERPLLNGILGPTFTCIIADQFLRIKKGDRFWYEYEGSPGAFTPNQLKELHKVSLARILCNNVPEIASIQPHPLKLPSAINPKVHCDSPLIPQYSLDPWQT